MQEITTNMFLKDRIEYDDLDYELQQNALRIIDRANDLLSKFGEFRMVNSGYRTHEEQMKINPHAPLSKHQTCQAIDLEDKDCKLKQFVKDNEQVLIDIGLWCEALEHTPTWLHIQCVPPRSGNRFFIP